MNLMKGITGYRGLRERKRGEDWEIIWKRLGEDLEIQNLTARNWKKENKLLFYQKNV